MQIDKKILFTDLDGTLLNDEKNISPGNQAAIDEALAAGHAIVISTGRSLPSALMLAERLGFTGEGCYVIAWNGAQIYDLYHKKTIYGSTLPRSLARPLFDAAAAKGIHIQTYDRTHVLSEHDNPMLRDYEYYTGHHYRIVPDIERALPEDPYKMLAILYNGHERLEAFRQEILTAYPETVSSFFSSDDYLEIVPKDVSKGHAIRVMCDYLGIPMENSVAAGDAQNDISMLEAAHVGAVMRNAYPGIAEHGNYVTESDNNHDGLAEIIRKFILQ